MTPTTKRSRSARKRAVTVKPVSLHIPGTLTLEAWENGGEVGVSFDNNHPTWTTLAETRAMYKWLGKVLKWSDSRRKAERGRK